jgi:large subunit ribosomal protein L15
MMQINDLGPLKNSRGKKKRVGRGPGSGHGKTSCRGHKGQKSRSGGTTPPGFEGGQMPLQRRLPKRGFTNIHKKEYAVINIRDLKRFGSNSNVDSNTLKDAGIVKKSRERIKLLGVGEISHSITVKVHKASKTAIRKIETAGGKVEVDSLL